jgi:hypothetical protein
MPTAPLSSRVPSHAPSHTAAPTPTPHHPRPSLHLALPHPSHLDLMHTTPRDTQAGHILTAHPTYPQ